MFGLEWPLTTALTPWSIVRRGWAALGPVLWKRRERACPLPAQLCGWRCPVSLRGYAVISFFIMKMILPWKAMEDTTTRIPGYR